MESFPPIHEIDHPAMPKSRLNSLLIILMVTLFASGAALLAIKEIDAYNRKQLYIAEQAALPVHKGTSTKKSQTPTTTPESVKDWKTYENQKYGFSFEYPGDFVLTEDQVYQLPDENNQLLDVVGVQVENKSGAGIGFSMNRPSAGCGEFAKRISKQTLKNDSVTLTKYTNTNDGSNSYCVEYFGYKVGHAQATYLKSDKASEAILDKIALSFKFTNKQSNEWKTYKNEKYGFEFEYPADFVSSQDSTSEFSSFSLGPDGMGIEILNTKFNKNNIQNSGGPVEDATPVSVGVLTGYMYGNGDGPWTSTQVELALGNKTLKIGFSSIVNEGSSPYGVGTLYKDKTIINKVLSSFKFTK